MVVHGIGPGFLVFGEDVHLAAEEEQLLFPFVASVVGREHLVVLPHVRAETEPGCGNVGPVLQAGGLDEGGVKVHVHVVVEHEKTGLGVVGSVLAFYYLSVLVPHGGAALKDSHGVLGVVVKVAGSEGVLVVIFQLDQVSAELGHVVVNHVLERCAG